MIPVGPWSPDTPDLGNAGSTEALNVIPAGRSYRPFPGFATISNALGTRCQGAIFVRRSDGSALTIAGTATKLYRLSLATFSDISRTSGGAYACPADGFWSFAQFGSKVLAFNGADAPQVFDVDSDSSFSALSGSPPTATYAAVVGDFVVTGQQSTARNRLQWSGINDATSWTPSQVTQADSQDLPDGGWIQGIVPFDQSMTIFQEFCIRRGAYVGTPLVFQFGKIADTIGLRIPGSLATYRDKIFFCDRAGFFMMQGGYVIQPIGEERVNRWFWERVDQGNLQLVSAAIDPVNSLYACAFPDAGLDGYDGTAANHVLIYHYDLDRWAHVLPGNLDWIYSGAAQVSWTLEDLDSFGTIEAVPFPFDSTAWVGIAARLISGFDSTHKLGFFNGPSLAATVDSTEAAPAAGRLARIRSARPLVDAGPVTPSMQLGTRNRQVDEVSWGAASVMNAIGTCPFNTAARYMRGRITVPAGQSWDHIIGIDDVDAAPAGRQ